MYINPFLAGVLTTLFVEVAFIIIFVITHITKVVRIEEDEEDTDNEFNSKDNYN